MTGLHLSQYRIDAELGRGGMGIVYKATDTKLNRTVALKVLPPSALASEDDRARFFREAQAAAQLHHPNIATVFQIDEAVPVDDDGKIVEGHTEKRPFIAMEFVEGQTLSEYIKKGPVKLTEAVSVAGQVAEALKEAHAKEIVHRDIKSANVMLTEAGVAKVLDFGLAKTNQSTMLTRMGSTLGTVAYMSPEQARGQEVDGRTDLYALGTMLYEMVAGRLPFGGDYEQAVLYSILNEPPEPLTALRTGVPMDLERVVAKLLSKEAEYRYQSAAGLLADLKSLDLTGSGVSRRSMTAASAAAMPAATSATPSLPRWVWVALPSALILGSLLAWLVKPTPVVERDTAVRTYALDLPGFNSIGFLTPSDDGGQVAIVGSDTTGRFGIHVKDLETGDTSPLGPGGSPVFSRDGSMIAFWRAGALYTVPTSGGSPAMVDSPANRTVSWLEDNSIVYTRQGELWIRPGDGSDPRLVAAADSTSFHEPSILPGDRYVLVCSSDGVDSREQLEVIDLRSGERTRIGEGTRPRYARSGHLIYGDPETGIAGPLFARPFDASSWQFTGPQIAIAQNAPVWMYDFDPNGTLYHRFNNVDEVSAVPESSIFAMVPGSEQRRFVFSGPSLEVPRLSPTDDRVAVTVESGDDYLMIYDPVADVKQQITFSGDEDHHAWAADGERIMLERKGALEIWSTRGGGLLESLPVESVNTFDWAPDGNLVAYEHRTVDGLRLFDMSTGIDTLLDAGNVDRPRFSPDSRYIAYGLDSEDGDVTVVRAVDGSTVVRLSIDAQGSGRPVWSPDGEAIFVDTGRDVVRVPVQTANGFSQTGPSEIVSSIAGSYEFDVGRDGTIYYTSSDFDRASSNRIYSTVVVNWFEQLKRLAPPGE